MTKNKTLEERENIRMAANGHRVAFDGLVQTHYKVVFAHAYKMLRNRDDAADATQVTFVKVHRSLREFDLERPLRPWLLRICANACTDIIRKKARGGSSLEQHAYRLVSEDRVEEAAVKSEFSEQVRRAIARLPEKYRKIIMLRHYEHMDVEEIASRLGAPEGTVKSWLFRARAILKKDLEPTFASVAA